MSDETRRILDLLAQGKVSVDEADQLLKAVGAAPPDAPKDAPREGAAPRVRFVRIAVQKAATEEKSEKQVNVRVPIALLQGGMRLSAMIPGCSEAIAEQLRERGVDVDLSKLDQVRLEEVLKSMEQLTVDVDHGKARVLITCE
jgi:SHOCT-like protein